MGRGVSSRGHNISKILDLRGVGPERILGMEKVMTGA